MKNLIVKTVAYLNHRNTISSFTLTGALILGQSVMAAQSGSQPAKVVGQVKAQTVASAKAAEPALKLSQSFNPSTIAADEFTTLTIELSNPGSSALLMKSAYHENLPKGVVIVGPSSTTCVGSLKADKGGAKVALTDLKMPAYSACHVLVGVSSAKVGKYEMKSSSKSMASLTVKKAEPKRLSVNRSYNPKKIKLNEFTTLSITLTNPNREESALTSSYSESLPEGMVILGSASSNCKGKLTAQPGSAKVALAEAKIPARSSCEILLGVTVKERKAGVAAELLQPELGGSSEKPTANMMGN